MVKVKIKAVGADAKKLLGGSLPDASGSNFVSPNDLHTPAGVTGQGTSRLTRGSERVTQRDNDAQETTFKNPSDLHNYPASGTYRGQRFPALRMGDAQVAGELDDMRVKPVSRVMNPVEAIRRANNAARDLHTNHGRGKAGTVVSNEQGADGAGKW